MNQPVCTFLIYLHFKFWLFWFIIHLPHFHSFFILFLGESLLLCPTQVGCVRKRGRPGQNNLGCLCCAHPLTLKQQHKFWPNIAGDKCATAREREICYQPGGSKLLTDMEAKRRNEQIVWNLNSLVCKRDPDTFSWRLLSASLETSAWNGERDCWRLIFRFLCLLGGPNKTVWGSLQILFLIQDFLK